MLIYAETTNFCHLTTASHIYLLLNILHWLPDLIQNKAKVFTMAYECWHKVPYALQEMPKYL